MKRIILGIIMILAITSLGCKNSSNEKKNESSDKKDDSPVKKDDGQIKLIIEKCEISKNQLNIDYLIQNQSVDNIWVCETVERGDDIEALVEIDKERVIIQKRRYVLNGSVRATAAVSEYVKISPGSKRKNYLSIPVPVEERGTAATLNRDMLYVELIKQAREDGCDDDAIGKRLRLDKVKIDTSILVFEVGYFENAAVQELLSGQIASEMIHFSHLWPGRKNEKLLQVIEDNVSIPCLLEKYSLLPEEQIE